MTEEKGVVEYKARDGSDMKLTVETCKRYLVTGKAELVTNQEFMFFMATCKAKGMNPFIKDCYLIKYGQENAAIITSIEFYRKRSKAQEDCQGWKNGIILKNESGLVEYRDGAFLAPGETLLGGWFECLPKGWIESMKWSVSLKPYIKKTKEGNVTQFWQEDKQPGQIAKVAEAQGLRKVWSGEFQGLYVDAEMQSRDAQERLDAAANGPLKEEEDPAVEKAFTALFFRGDKQDESIRAFVAASAKGNNVTEYSIKEAALKDSDSFLKAFSAWVKKQKPEPVKQTKKAAPKQAEPELEPYPATIEDVEDLEEAVKAEEEPKLPPINDQDFIPCEGTGKRFPIGKCKVCPVNEKCDAYGNYLNEHQAK